MKSTTKAKEQDEKHTAEECSRRTLHARARAHMRAVRVARASSVWYHVWVVCASSIYTGRRWGLSVSPDSGRFELETSTTTATPPFEI